MVTTTHDDDDYQPTHDANGTDLRRVRAMLAAGFTDSLIAEALSITIHAASYAIIVATNDREGAPDLDQLAALCREIQAGWTPEQAAAARHGEARMSSLVVRPHHAITCQRREDSLSRRQAERIAEGEVPVFERPTLPPSMRWQARVDIQIFGKRRYAAQSFPTREEAQEWGRAWMRRQWDEAHAGACVGR